MNNTAAASHLQNHDTLEFIANQISALFAPLGCPLEYIAENTGKQWGIVPEELFWFRPAGFHIFETIVVFPFLYFLWKKFGVPCTEKLLGGKNYLEKKTPRSNNHPYYSAVKPSFAMDYVLGIILAICWIAQVIFKASRPNPVIQLFWMVVPCHVITATWAYVLLSPPSWKNYQTCRFLAALLSMSSWGGVMASLFPDWSDHQYKIEGFMFYLHHGALLLIPHYWAAKHGMLRLTPDLFWTYIVVALGINFFFYTPLCYISGVNINYNLHPHLGMKHRTQWYRFLVPTVLAIWGLVYWYFTVLLNKIYFALFVSAGRSERWRGSSYEVLSPPVSRANSFSPPPSASPLHGFFNSASPAIAKKQKKKEKAVVATTSKKRSTSNKNGGRKKKN